MKSSETRGSRGKLVLYGVGAASWIAASALFAQSLPLDAAEGRQTSIAQRTALQTDPPVGSRFAWFDSNTLAPVRSDERHLVLIALGGCNSCSDHAFQESSLDASEGASFVKVLSHGQPDVLIRKVVELGSRITYEVRLPMAAYDTLNAQWTPRFYIVDRQGRLAFLQRISERPSEFFRRSRS